MKDFFSLQIKILETKKTVTAGGERVIDCFFDDNTDLITTTAAGHHAFLVVLRGSKTN